MAEKTVRFAVPTTVSTALDAVVTNLAQHTIFIPEASPVFSSVTMEVGFHDQITATGGTIGEHRVGLRLGAAAFTTFIELDDITNSGENMGGVIGPVNFTAHFNTNWTGTSMTMDTQVCFDHTTGTTLGMVNVNADIVITYEYDDNPAVNATQIKTAYIPLESLAGALATTANSNIGANQIPILTGGATPMLPEASVVIRDYFFIIEGNVTNNGTATDFIVNFNIDSGTATPLTIIEAGLASDYFVRYIYRPVLPSSTVTHNFQMWSSVANKMNHVTITLVVTYAFAPASSTVILNSLILPIEIASPLGVTTPADASRFTRDIFVEEPTIISLRQSAFRINFNTTAAIAGLNFRAGSQAYRAYTHSGSVVAGMFSLQQRIDSGSAQGVGMTLARGRNTIVIDGYSTDTVDQATNINGCIVLNYTSGKAASGLIGQHTHTVEKLLDPWNAQLLDRVRTNNYSFAIAPTNHWVVGAGFQMYIWASTAANAVTFDVECLAGEGKGGGYYDINADAVQTDAERGCSIVYMRGRDVFQRYPGDPDPERLDMEVARDYRLFNAATSGNGMYMMVTYHSNTFTIAGIISGFTG